MQYKVTIDGVDGERFYVAGGPDKAELLTFLMTHDHEGSSVRLEWCATGDEGARCVTFDAEFVYHILAGDEVPPDGDSRVEVGP
jgi:hypothetical protein